ncbi:hypothetical protein JW897_06410 [Chromobacterium alkanivorans]|uniref:hypothetical protein n=1 Tax=Chromobacterium TaxID=535 RepID=UPI001966DB76|nr:MULTISPECIES: hypothetical protein [Chromobacterium]MBN3003368.1 hypothetical protein [Chromobacterium alkanivorans]MDH0340633.1 hypothetical protein [Chromobacterium haemolyticum]
MSVDVVKVVMKAMELVSAEGSAKAVNHGRVPGASTFIGAELLDFVSARRLLDAAMRLPAEQYLALMWQVLKNDPRQGWLVCQDLAAFVANNLGPADGNRFGREGLLYWVRHWARKDGSCREAAHMYGASYGTHHVFYVEKVKVILDSWLIAAKGRLEEVIFSSVEEAA